MYFQKISIIWIAETVNKSYLVDNDLYDILPAPNLYRSVEMVSSNPNIDIEFEKSESIYRSINYWLKLMFLGN